MTNSEIAAALRIALPTVDMHFKRARRRVGARTREQAIAIVEKLIDVPVLAADIAQLRRTG
jgi:DNA-binding CsgD family transcriptional regulator